MESWAQRFFELSTELFLVLGADGRILHLNPAWTGVVGSSLDALESQDVRGFIHPDDLAAMESQLHALAGSDARGAASCRWRCQDGSWQWLSWSMVSSAADPRLYCTVRVSKAPPAVSVNPDTPVLTSPPTMSPWRLSDRLPLGLYAVDLDTHKVLYANHRFCQLWGLEALEPELRRGGVGHAQVLQHCLRAGDAASLLRLPAGPETGVPANEDEVPLANGRSLRRISTAITDHKGVPRYQLFAFEDVTERKRTEEALHRSEQSFRKLIEGAPEVIFVHRDKRFVYVNPTMLRALGYDHASELIGRSIWDIVHPDDLPAVKDRVQAVEVRGELAPLREIRYQRRDGSWFYAESAGLAVEFDGAEAVVVMARDITERKRIQAQLLQNDRMALVGTLAAGVGHEINNPLTYVLANLNLALDALTHLNRELLGAVPEMPIALAWSAFLRETEELLKEAQEGSSRVRNIVRDLKFVSRQQEEHRALVDVREPLEFSIKMAASELRPRAQVIKKYEPVPAVYADASRLGQVFLNLLVNAAQALPEGNPTDNLVTLWVRPCPTSGRVAVDVTDTGPGIPPELLARIFDPFFTTKPVGMGTGLGLSICHGIIRNLGGEITVQSELGRGTTFTLYLPTSVPAQVRAAPVAPAAPAPRAEAKGRVLVVDDEPAIGRSLARIIGPKHSVTVVNSGEQALEVLAEQEPFDLVFCDLMMPGVTGMDVFTREHEMRPDRATRFVFITGGSYTPRARQFLETVANRRIEKPFDMEMIHKVLGEVLGAS